MPSWKDSFTPEQLEIRRQRAKEWNRLNKERVKLNQDHYKAENADYIKERAKKYAQRKEKQSPGYFKRVIDRFYAGRPWHKHYCWAKSRCNPKTKNKGWQKYYIAAGITFNLTPEDIKYLWIRDNAANMHKPSLDRIYIAKNYTLDNCRFLEQSDNSSRRFNPDAKDMLIKRRIQRYNESLNQCYARP